MRQESKSKVFDGCKASVERKPSTAHLSPPTHDCVEVKGRRLTLPITGKMLLPAGTQPPGGRGFTLDATS